MNFYKNAKVIFPDKIRDCVVVTDGGKITDICERFDANENDTVTDCKGLYLSPGFVDIHVHGGGNKSAMSTDYTDIVEMAEAHLKYGTTSIAPTTLAAPISQLKEAVLSIKKASEESKKANILGVHLEGPYISLQYKGAQSPESILNPEKDPPEELLDLWDKILIMGAAPECDGVLALGDKLRKRGIVASVAHSAASYEQVETAVQHGFSDVTHIYNACSSCFKTGLFRNAGVVEAGLYMDELTTQTIADLRHLPQGLLKLIYKCKGDSKMYLITDGLEFSASDIKENTVYTQENGVNVIYEDRVMKLADRSALAGSAATLSDCVRNMYKCIGIPLYSAVKMATLTPAEVCGYGKVKGKIENGYDADLIMFDDDINIKSVITNGKII
ncbi:MAG: N-acetylglucosamine-6-phosphate deacetylase [Clostridia bacterium]|nr:N-acetylglucosamine-6-phosphate deacetylase [Clostridia bacterium]